MELVREIRRGSTALTARRKVGYVGVDSGQVIITDPCYLRNFESNNFDDSKSNSTGRSRYSKKVMSLSIHIPVVAKRLRQELGN